MHLGEGSRAFAFALRSEVVAGGDGEVTQGGHRVGGAAVGGLGTVLVVGAVATIVQGVLDGPMGAQGRAEGEFAEGVGAAAGEDEDGFRFLATVGEEAFAIHPCDLRDMGEGPFAGAHGAGLHRAGFDPAVAFLTVRALRGKKPARGRAGRIVPAGRAGWL